MTSDHQHRRAPHGLLLVLAFVLAAGGVQAQQPLDIRPAQQPAVRAKPVARGPTLPPVRPAGVGLPREAGQIASGATVVTAAAEPARPQPKLVSPSGPLSNAEAVERLNAYFNSFSSLQGDFIQFASDGKRFEGKLHVQRPGRIRFEYRPPVTMEVIADGRSVAIRDRKLATQDLYSIGQTPLKFLLKERIDLARDTTVIGVRSKGDTLSVALEDRSTLGGTSKITLTYDLAANELRQWVVVDPQGYETSVALYNLDTQRRPDPKLFVINYERMIDTK